MTEIDKLFEKKQLDTADHALIESAIAALDAGKIRVVEKKGDAWITHEWIKKAILLYFKIKNVNPIQAGELHFLDKIPLKTWTIEKGVRVVPPAIARFGSYIEPGAILMPSFVNIGAFVGAGTMVDTWATVGSCAHVGKNVHLSGGVGIGGVLEPLQAQPVIIEDDVFIGSRSVVVEGVHLEEGCVIGAGVVLTASTKIIDVSGSEEKVLKGTIPKNSVVIPGSYTKDFPAGNFGVPCALIIGTRQESTDKKTSLTAALRNFNIPV